MLQPRLSFAQTCPIDDLSNFKIVAANFMDSNCAIKLPFLSYWLIFLEFFFGFSEKKLVDVF